jgi:hypothetical protein
MQKLPTKQSCDKVLFRLVLYFRGQTCGKKTQSNCGGAPALTPLWGMPTISDIPWAAARRCEFIFYDEWLLVDFSIIWTVYFGSIHACVVFCLLWT